jgi:hypothetical protein
MVQLNGYIQPSFELGLAASGSAILHHQGGDQRRDHDQKHQRAESHSLHGIAPQCLSLHANSSLLSCELFVTFLSPLFVTPHAITLDEQREEIRGSKMWIGLVFCSMSHVR